MNLVTLIQSHLTPQILDPISSALTESASATRCSFDAAIPALLGSLAIKTILSPTGANEVHQLVRQNQAGGADSASNLLSNYGNGAAGHPLLTLLLGNRIEAAANFIAGHCRVKNSSAFSILGMAAPLVLNAVGKHASAEGLSPAGLAQLLTSQAPYLRDTLPPGLAGSLGLSTLLKSASDTTRIGTPSPETLPQGSEAPVPYTSATVPGRGGGTAKWAVPLVLFVLTGWFVMNRNQPAGNSGGTADYSTSESGSMLNLTPRGPADKLALAASTRDANEIVHLEGLVFDSSGSIADQSRETLREISAVLKARPEMKIRITGFGTTEDKGLDRANTIRTELVASGVAPNRLEADGEAGKSEPTVTIVQ